MLTRDCLSIWFVHTESPLNYCASERMIVFSGFLFPEGICHHIIAFNLENLQTVQIFMYRIKMWDSFYLFHGGIREEGRKHLK